MENLGAGIGFVRLITGVHLMTLSHTEQLSMNHFLKQNPKPKNLLWLIWMRKPTVEYDKTIGRCLRRGKNPECGQGNAKLTQDWKKVTCLKCKKTEAFKTAQKEQNA